MEFPSFKYEKKLFKRGFEFIAGADEVGRGCFAGPVVTGCVVFNRHIRIPENIVINDSKKVNPIKREISSAWIKQNALTWGIGEAPASLINRLGMNKTTDVAFRKSIKNANERLKGKLGRKTPVITAFKNTPGFQPGDELNADMSSSFRGNPAFQGGKDVIDFLLIDGFCVNYIRGLRRKNQLAIVSGDSKSVSIAAASIIAKVYRDKLMVLLDKKAGFKKYRWGNNKGYGTRQHRSAIVKHGITRYHRKSFVSTFLGNMNPRA